MVDTMINYASTGTTPSSSVLTAKDVTKITEKFFKVIDGIIAAFQN